ncbi:MAG TPA: DUF4404 family protein [Pirellulales bacterium]|jgi:hypothetical protein
MTDAANDLRDTLVQLHEKLRDMRDVNDETRVLLLEIIDDIRLVIGGSAPTDRDGHGSLIARLRAAEHAFEATHPTLAGVIGGLIDILGQMGI